MGPTSIATAPTRCSVEAAPVGDATMAAAAVEEAAAVAVAVEVVLVVISNS